MRILISVMGAFFLVATTSLVVMNWAAAIVSLRNQRKGIDRHHSLVPIVSVWLALFAMFMWPYWPGKWVLLLPAIDVANLNLVFSPLYLLPKIFRRPSPRRVEEQVPKS